MSANAFNQVELNLASTLTNPGGNFELAVHDEEFPTEPLTQDEAQLFESQMNDLLTIMPNSVHAQVLKSREDAIALSAAYAKAEIDSKVFGGINAGDNQIGFSTLRPGHIRADPSNGNIQNDWFFTPGGTGWVDWIGDGSNNNYGVGEDQVSVVIAFTDQDVDTEISGLNIDEFGRNMDMLPADLNDARLADNDSGQLTVPLPTLIASNNDDVYAKLRYDQDQQSQPRFVGITYALGDFLNNQDY